jgi:hypothetical protein
MAAAGTVRKSRRLSSMPLSVEETAEVLKVSPATVRRDWSIAKVWLYRELGGDRGDESGTVETTR